MPGLDVRGFAADDHVAHVQTDGRQDIALCAVRIEEKGDVRASVRIVLDGLDRRGHAVFISLEIDDAVLSSVAAADVPDGDLALRVSAAALSLIFEQRALGLRRRYLVIRADRHEAARGRTSVYIS